MIKEAVEKLVVPSKRFIWAFLAWTFLSAITASLLANVMSRYYWESEALIASILLLILIFVFIIGYLHKMKNGISLKSRLLTIKYKGVIAFVSEPPRTNGKKYLFGWDKVPGSDDLKLKDFYINNFGLGWVKNANIEKIDNGRTIKIFSEKYSILVSIYEEYTKVISKIDELRSYEFIVEIENGAPTIYHKTKEIKNGWINECKEKIDKFVSTGKKFPKEVEEISGIGSIFKAINHHLGEINHCWLIHTKDSDINIQIIRYFFQKVLNDAFKPDFVEILDPNDPKLINEQIEEIYNDLPDDITATEIISDITSGTKPMTSGMIIACLNGDHKIEYVEQSEKADLIEIDLSPKIIVKL